MRLAAIVALAALFAQIDAAKGETRALPAAGTLSVARVVARAAPDPAAPAVHVFRDFRPDFRPQYVFAEHERKGADGQRWLHVQLPMRPNGGRGWIPAASSELRPVTTTVIVYRSSRRLEVVRNRRMVFRTIVAVGKPGAETPLGDFYVTWRFAPSDAFYGPFALETSAYSRLSDWPGGGIVGIHGTNKPWLLGQAVSHGCVRVANRAALMLKRLVPVGSRVTIRR